MKVSTEIDNNFGYEKITQLVDIITLKFGNKFRALPDKKKKNLTFVLSEKKILNETKNHNSPFKLNGRSLR
jgi:hypothetical protein